MSLWILLRLLMLPAFVSAHAGCCGDIPESAIWTLSFFALIGFVIVGVSYYPSESTCESKPPIVFVKIDPTDLAKCVDILNNRRGE